MAGAKRKVEASQGATPAGAGATSTGSMTPSAGKGLAVQTSQCHLSDFLYRPSHGG
jgi:hypothetical protein